MPKLLMMTILTMLAVAAGCCSNRRTTATYCPPAQPAYACPPANPCASPCGPGVSGTTIEMGAPMLQPGTTIIEPGPETYSSPTPVPANPG